MSKENSEHLAVRTLSPFGVEIDFDLREAMTSDQQGEFKDLFYQHSLILARDQQLTQDEQVRVLEYIGPVRRTPGDGVGYVSTDPTKGNLGKVELAFHSDIAFTPRPIKVISLHAIDVVDGRTSTRFANALHACAALPSALRAEVNGLVGVHAFSYDQSRCNIGEHIPDGMPHAGHPVILCHPVTGKFVLYVSELLTFHIENVSPERSSALLRQLCAVLYRAEHIFEHRWNRGDIVLWDNLSLQHARGNVADVGPRTLQRVAIVDKSFEEQCPQFRMDDPQYQRWNHAETNIDQIQVMHELIDR